MDMQSTLVLLLTGILCILPNCSKSSPDLDAVIAAAIENDEYVVSGKGTASSIDLLKESGARVEKVSGNGSVDADYAFDREKRYSKFHYRGRGNIPYQEAGYDGSKMWKAGVTLDETGETAVRNASSQKKLKAESFAPDRFDPRFTGLRVLNNPVGALLANARSDTSPGYRITRKPKLLKDETVAGIPCKVVTFAQKNDVGQYTVCKLWLAPSLRYRAVKILLESQGSGPLAGKEALDFRIAYRTAGKELPFPASVEIRRMVNNRLFMHRKTVFNPDWRVNVPIPDSTFQIGDRPLERKEFKVGEFSAKQP